LYRTLAQNAPYQLKRTSIVTFELLVSERLENDELEACFLYGNAIIQ